MSEPCDCHACVVAGVDRPAVTLPPYRDEPMRTLHGRELADFYRAQDELRAVLVRFKDRPITHASTGRVFKLR